MNLLELRTRLRSWLREPEPNFYNNTELTEWCNTASHEATKDVNYPYKLHQESGVQDTFTYSLPSDFIKLHPLLNVYYNNKKLDKRDHKWIEYTYPDYRAANSVTQPEYYYHNTPSTISLYAPPDAALVNGLEFYYVYKESTMSGDTTTTLIATNYPYLILYRAIQNAEWKQEDDLPKHRDLNWWETKYLQELDKAKRDINKFIRGHSTRTVSPTEME